MFTAIDMHFTARHYHPRLESLATVALVFVLFQSPIVSWLGNCRRISGAGAGAAAAAGAKEGANGAAAAGRGARRGGGARAAAAAYAAA